ncbi:peptidoglycan transglycosylase [Actibacterium mucosum KCTC 23349]|uniref:Biosynthetic peptidoglycan transglycosylase n=1 Tax=Actibacterium mucosum KCTC 23349 TaxID=1454373 RepID=A0A037ZNN1_9RHOB|nr:monofunctional biosynthetic peptidoglycan transglycosylase [Actibacterium mucosum]KAJ57153.1 peptidoglycan transglycosylase [Actibacterium mucosum KCTC 23349]
MAKRKIKKPQERFFARNWRRFKTGLRWVLLFCFVVPLLSVTLYGFVNPPMTHTIFVEIQRLGDVDWEWIDVDDVAPEVLRAVVAAEDSGFCNHWGFDMDAIRAALDDGASRGASSLTQQTVKNVFLWQGRSWTRKSIEALLTPLVEALWSKRRILEVYLNVAEFGEGVFGIDAAAHRYFETEPSNLTAAQAARLAVVLPNPKERNPARLPTWLGKHAARVADGAATIKADGRSSCFEG